VDLRFCLTENEKFIFFVDKNNKYYYTHVKEEIMGQLFDACAYDVENKKCCVFHADKFHANCYSYSGAVFSMHYLLRQAPYRIMWSGSDLIEDISEVNNEEHLFFLFFAFFVTLCSLCEILAL
jgi:hypothetical protein